MKAAFGRTIQAHSEHFDLNRVGRAQLFQLFELVEPCSFACDKPSISWKALPPIPVDGTIFVTMHKPVRKATDDEAEQEPMERD